MGSKSFYREKNVNYVDLSKLVRERDFMTARKFQSDIGSIILHKFLSKQSTTFVTMVVIRTK